MLESIIVPIVELHRTCQVCNESHQITLPRDAYLSWQAGSLIQDVMPELPVNTRELLISGICGTCFDHLFVDENDDVVDPISYEPAEDAHIDQTRE